VALRDEPGIVPSSTWNTLLFGMVLGASAARYTMVYHWLRWVEVYVTAVLRWKNLNRNMDGATHLLPGPGTHLDNTAVTLLEYVPTTAEGDHRPVLEAGPIPATTVALVDRGQSITEVDCAQTENQTADTDGTEANELGRVMIRGSIGAVTDVEKVAGHPSLIGSEHDLGSVDLIMRLVHDMLAPELEYQPMDQQMDTQKVRHEALADARDILQALHTALGRFSIRQGNLKLLKKIYRYSSICNQEQLWLLAKVSIEYNRLDSFMYLLCSATGDESRDRLLELCAYHDRVDMMEKTFEKWTSMVRSDAANKPLVVAAAQGHIKSVRFLLTKCTNLEVRSHSNFVDEIYPTAVMAASASGNRAILQELFAAGAKLREYWPFDIDKDPIKKACVTRNVTMLACLLQCDPSPIKNSCDRTAGLSLAVEFDNQQVLSLILAGTIDNTDKTGPFRKACQRGHLEFMHSFINSGANSESILPYCAQDGKEDTPDSPARKRHKLIVRLLWEHCPAGSHKQILSGWDTVQRLACLGDIEGLRMLLDEEPHLKLESPVKQLNSPLFLALHNHVRWRKGEVVGAPEQWLKMGKFLISRGARMNHKDTQHSKYARVRCLR
jgi:hypothetical protein